MSDQSADFNIKLSVRSARVLRAVRAAFGTAAEMSRQTGISGSVISAFVTMRETPVGANGWTGTAEKFAAALGVYPSELWPAHMQDVRMKTSAAEVELSEADVIAISGTESAVDQKMLIERAMRKLTDRERTAVLAHMDGANLDDIAEAIGARSRERSRQILMKSMAKMRKCLLVDGVRTIEDAL